MILFVLVLSQPARAESVMYIDSSGNIHFADSITQIPPEYRWQALPPTPGPPRDAKARKKWEKERQKAIKLKELEEKKRLKAEEREKKRKEKEEARQLKKAQLAEEKAREKEEKMGR